MRSCSYSNPDGVIRENCTSTQKKKVGLKWNISPDTARAGERYLWCAVKANNTSTDQFSITAKKMSMLWQSVLLLLLLPFDFFCFLTTQAVMAKRPKGQERRLYYATPTDVNGLSLGDFVGTGFVHSSALGRGSQQDQVGRTVKKHLWQCKFPVPPSWMYPACRRCSHTTAMILNPTILNLL